MWEFKAVCKERMVEWNGGETRQLSKREESSSIPKWFAVRKRHLGVINPRLRGIPDDKFLVHSAPPCAIIYLRRRLIASSLFEASGHSR